MLVFHVWVCNFAHIERGHGSWAEVTGENAEDRNKSDVTTPDGRN